MFYLLEIPVETKQGVWENVSKLLTFLTSLDWNGKPLQSTIIFFIWIATLIGLGFLVFNYVIKFFIRLKKEKEHTKSNEIEEHTKNYDHAGLSKLSDLESCLTTVSTYVAFIEEKIKDLGEKFESMEKVNLRVLDEVEKLIGSVSIDVFKKIVEIVSAVFITNTKKIIFDYIENDRAVLEEFYIISNQIEASFCDSIVNYTSQFVLNKQEYVTSLKKAVYHVIESKLIVIEKRIISENKKMNPETKRFITKQLVDLKESLIDNMAKFYKDFVSMDGSIKQIKERG